MQQTQRNEICPDFRPNTFIAAMKMADFKECPDKQLLLFDRLLRYYDTSSIVFPTALQAIHNKTKLNFRQLLDHMMQIYRRKYVYLSTTEIISTLDYDAPVPEVPKDVVKVTTELLQLPVEKQPWFFGNLSNNEIHSICGNFPTRNSFLLVFYGSRLFTHQKSTRKRVFNSENRKSTRGLPFYGHVNKSIVRDFHLYQFYQRLVNNDLEGMKQMKALDWARLSRQWHQSSDKDNGKFVISIIGNQPHPLVEYLNVVEAICDEVVEWLFELCPLKGICFEWERNEISDHHLPIIKRAISQGARISLNLWQQYITKVMPTKDTELNLLAQAWDKIESRKPWNFIFTEFFNLCKKKRIISETKMAVLLAWKHATGELIGFRDLPKELVQLIVEFIDEPPFIRTFATILGSHSKQIGYTSYRKFQTSWLETNLWSIDYFANEFPFPISTMFKIVRTVTLWDFSMFRKLKKPIIYLLLRCGGVCSYKFVLFLFKYETEVSTLDNVWTYIGKHVHWAPQTTQSKLTMEALKTQNRITLKFLMVHGAFELPSKEEFNARIKPKHNITYEEASTLAKEIQEEIQAEKQNSSATSLGQFLMNN
jgi:hypothetical protein